MRPVALKTAAELAADKPHGVRIKYVGGCRCVECRAANAAYEREMYKLRREGQGKALVDSERARRHIASLYRQQISIHAIAQKSGVGITIIRLIHNGLRQQIRAHTERRLLKIVAPKATQKTKRKTLQ